MSEKTYPVRKCISCGEHKHKSELIRIVRVSDSAAVDITGKRDGRGCYICKNRECIQNAQKMRRVERALSVSVEHEIYENIYSCFSEE